MIIAFVVLSMFRRAGGRRYRARHSSGISPWVVLWGLNELSRGSRGGGWGGGRPGAAAEAHLGRRRRWRRLRRIWRRVVRRRRGIGLMVIRLSEADHDKVSAAIAAAEAKSNGEIVAVATPISDPYHDVALHWALVPLFAVLAWAAWRPTALAWWYEFLLGGWTPEPTLSQLLTLLMVFAALKFTVALLILK